MAKRSQKKQKTTETKKTFLQRKKYQIGWWAVFASCPIIMALFCIYWVPIGKDINIIERVVFAFFVSVIFAAIIGVIINWLCAKLIK